MLDIDTFAEFARLNFGVRSMDIYNWPDAGNKGELSLEEHESAYAEYVIGEIESFFQSYADYVAVAHECSVKIAPPAVGTPLHGLADLVTQIETPFTTLSYEVNFDNSGKNAGKEQVVVNEITSI